MKNNIKNLLLMSILLVLVGCSTNTVKYQENENKDEPKLKITWLGGPSMLLNFDGFKILTDPMLGTGKQAFIMGNPNEMFDLNKGPNITTFNSRINKVDLNTKEVDLVLLSHAHEDHFDQKAQKELSPTLPILLPAFDELKVKNMGFTNTEVLNQSETKTYKVGEASITITAVLAQHSRNEKIDSILGAGNGYWLAFKKGDWVKTLYWTGDAFLTKESMQSMNSLGDLDILVPHLGNVGVNGALGQLSMNAKDVLEYSLFSKAKNVLPIHHSTYDLYLEPISEFQILSKHKSYNLDILKEGESIVYK